MFRTGNSGAQRSQDSRQSCKVKMFRDWHTLVADRQQTLGKCTLASDVQVSVYPPTHPHQRQTDTCQVYVFFWCTGVCLPTSQRQQTMHTLQTLQPSNFKYQWIMILLWCSLHVVLTTLAFNPSNIHFSKHVPHMYLLCMRQNIPAFMFNFVNSKSKPLTLWDMYILWPGKLAVYKG